MASSQVNTASPLTISSRYALFLQLLSTLFDRIIQATLITANGTTLTLSDTENAELFWGIRGGGSNFGVCTEFVLRLHPQRPTIFSGLVVYPAEVLSELITVLNRWWKNAKKNEGMHMLLRKIPSSEEVGDNTFGITSLELMSLACRWELLWFCFTMDLRRKDVRISRNSLI